MPGMSEFSLAQGIIVVLSFFVAGIVKGVTGMGLPAVAMGLLGSIMPPVTAVSLLILPSLVTNLWQLLTGPGLAATVRRLWPMMLGVALGTLAGTWLLTSGDAGWSTPLLGLALVLYATVSLLEWQASVPRAMEPRLSPVIGLATGLIAGSTGVSVIPAAPYLQALGLGREMLVQALGLTFTISTFALAAGLARGGAFHLGSLGASLLSLGPALLGLWCGGIVRRRISPPAFRRWFLAVLLLLGLQLLLRGLF
jgi:uncharacterized membrane protein YfcA